MASNGAPQGVVRRAMNISIISGATGTLWVIACSPQAIFNVFVRNHLGAGSAQLGLLVGILSAAAIMQLPSILIYSRVRSRKWFWIVTSIIHRLNGPILAVAAFAVARGADRKIGLVVVFTAMIASWVVTNLSSSNLVELDGRSRSALRTCPLLRAQIGRGADCQHRWLLRR